MGKNTALAPGKVSVLGRPSDRGQKPTAPRRDRNRAKIPGRRIQRIDYPAVIDGKQQYAGAAELLLNMTSSDSGGIRYGTAGRQFFTQA